MFLLLTVHLFTFLVAWVYLQIKRNRVVYKIYFSEHLHYTRQVYLLFFSTRMVSQEKYILVNLRWLYIIQSCSLFSLPGKFLTMLWYGTVRFGPPLNLMVNHCSVINLIITYIISKLVLRGYCWSIAYLISSVMYFEYYYMQV